MLVEAGADIEAKDKVRGVGARSLPAPPAAAGSGVGLLCETSVRRGAAQSCVYLRRELSDGPYSFRKMLVLTRRIQCARVAFSA